MNLNVFENWLNNYRENCTKIYNPKHSWQELEWLVDQKIDFDMTLQRLPVPLRMACLRKMFGHPYRSADLEAALKEVGK